MRMTAIILCLTTAAAAADGQYKRFGSDQEAKRWAYCMIAKADIYRIEHRLSDEESLPPRVLVAINKECKRIDR